MAHNLTPEFEKAVLSASNYLSGNPYSFPLGDAGLMPMKEKRN